MAPDSICSMRESSSPPFSVYTATGTFGKSFSLIQAAGTFTAILAGEENIREVIAFPKTQSGVDPLTNAPLPVDDKQLRDLGR